MISAKMADAVTGRLEELVIRGPVQEVYDEAKEPLSRAIVGPGGFEPPTS
jgi:hypothetical protein